VQSIEVTATGLPRNEFATFWQQSDTELSRGLDFLPRGSVFARFTHLQHAPFNYKIVVSISTYIFCHNIVWYLFIFKIIMRLNLKYHNSTS